MFDVFYFGPKPNLFEFEKPASSLEDAARQCRTGYYWYIYGNNDYTDFDFDYKPVPWQAHYIHTWPNQWQQDGEVYLAYKNNSGEYHFHEQRVHRLPIAEQWHIPANIDPATVDLRWCPDPADPPYIYHFPSQHQSACGVTYTVPGATDVKLVSPFVCQSLSNPTAFTTLIPVTEFDYTWHPNVLDPAYNYVWGNQWNPSTIEPTVVYSVSGAVEDKFMEDCAQVAPDKTNWELLDEIIDFDYSWRPNPTEPPYIYIFGNQWLTPEMRPALKYTVPGATEIKYMSEPRAHRADNPSKFNTLHRVDFDYSWEPDPGSPPYNYVFGNQWYPANIMPTVEYPMAGATETKFVDEPRAQLLERHDNHWHTLADCKWDYSWVPDPGDPAYIYVFGNQWHPATVMPTVEYHVPGATERKFVGHIHATLVEDRTRWTIPEEINADTIDFSWVPDPGSPPYIYHFGSQYQKSTGLTYTVPGATETRFEDYIPLKERKEPAIEVLDIFFVDKNNDSAQTRFELLKHKYPKIQKIRFANSMMDTIQRCVTRAKTNKFWVISSEYNYDDFDFAWHAEPWQSYMTHVFPSQHQKWSDTFLINKWEFERHSKWATGLEQFPNLNFVKDQQVRKAENRYNIYYVDHGNTVSQHQYEWLRSEHRDTGIDVIKTRFANSYLDTFKRIMSTAETEYVWIINSVCDYTQFDFTWEPEPWQRDMMHIFPSSMEERGDTFYVNVEAFKKQMVEFEVMDFFNLLNYCDDQMVSRFEMPVHIYDTDDLVTEIKNYNFTEPYAMFTNQSKLNFVATPCLWTEKDRVVERCSESGATCIVPRDIKRYLKTQIYDYPYLEDSNFRINEYYGDHSLPGMDLVFISNGEPDEQKMYEDACYVSNRTVKWVRGINGRTAAYQEAARQSETPWFFAVFAKLRLNPGFDWYWMPDYYQEPKHYIFNAHNPVNGLEYGHQGMIAYNKKLVLANNNPGIDFTLSQPHESVPLLSGIAEFNQDPWMTWRTAFREVVKLKHFMATEPTLETEHRLNVWCTQAAGMYSNYCIQGALDAVEYYKEVNGDYEKLKLSFEWAWLRERFNAGTLK